MGDSFDNRHSTLRVSVDNGGNQSNNSSNNNSVDNRADSADSGSIRSVTRSPESISSSGSRRHLVSAATTTATAATTAATTIEAAAAHSTTFPSDHTSSTNSYTSHPATLQQTSSTLQNLSLNLNNSLNNSSSNTNFTNSNTSPTEAERTLGRRRRAPSPLAIAGLHQSNNNNNNSSNTTTGDDQGGDISNSHTSEPAAKRPRLETAENEMANEHQQLATQSGDSSTAVEQQNAPNAVAAAATTSTTTAAAAVAAGESEYVQNGSLTALPQAVAQRPTPYDERELVRIIVQQLYDIGYRQSAQLLEQESGHAMETREAAQFRAAILDGNWMIAEQLVARLVDESNHTRTHSRNRSRSDGRSHGTQTTTTVTTTATAVTNGTNGTTALNGGASRSTETSAQRSAHNPRRLSRRNSNASALSTTSTFDLHPLYFQIRRQQYLEQLEAGQTHDALATLQTRIQPLCRSIVDLHELSSLLMAPSPEIVYSAAKWDGARGRSRLLLFESLQAALPPNAILPPHRLETLLGQALQNQTRECSHHRRQHTPMSLLVDHECDPLVFPRRPHQQITKGHSGEVWFVAFSHDGTRLVSTSGDKRAIIWSIRPRSNKAVLEHRLDGHTRGIGYAAWSPDDKMLVTCGQDCIFKVWNTATGAMLYSIVRHSEPVTCALWINDGTQFLTLGSDRSMFLWDASSGDMVHRWSIHRATELALNPIDGETLYIGVNDKSIGMFNLTSRSDVGSLAERGNINAMAVSSDGINLLVTMGGRAEIHMWDIPRCRLVHRLKGLLYHGANEAAMDTVVRPAFGGSREQYIICGAHNGDVVVWDRASGQLIERLSTGHQLPVNTVAWNAAKQTMFASASDDGTIALWLMASADDEAEGSNRAVDADDEMDEDGGSGEDGGDEDAEYSEDYEGSEYEEDDEDEDDEEEEEEEDDDDDIGQVSDSSGTIPESDANPPDYSRYSRHRREHPGRNRVWETIERLSAQQTRREGPTEGSRDPVAHLLSNVLQSYTGNSNEEDSLALAELLQPNPSLHFPELDYIGRRSNQH
ncbi:WD40 repeat-like protein [Ramicandelaber brevisporus]|nr:WD40 repeat-like protein [Ramicandelaber brevisporus]